MIRTNTLTFEQVEPAFHKWAIHFCRKYPNRFEYWELINSAWLDGTVRFLPQSKIKLASGRIRYDMIDYMRYTTRYRVRQNRLKKGKSFPYFHYISDITLMSPVDDGEGFETTLIAETVDIEQKDLIHYLTGHVSFSRTEKLFMRLMYVEGFTQVEAGNVCGFCESRISQMHKNLMARLRTLGYSKITG